MASFSPARGLPLPIWKALISLSLCLPLLANAEAPTAFSYQYGFTGAGIPFSISATRSLRQIENGQWQTELSAKNFLGSIREASTFQWEGCLPITSRYEYQRKGLGQSRSAILTLQQKANTPTAVLQREGKSDREFDIKPDTIDMLALPLAIQCRLQENEQAPLEFHVASEKRHETLRFRIMGTEVVKTPAGEFKALRVERQRKGNQRNTLMWFAPEHNYSLVRMKQEDGGSTYEMRLNKFS